VLGNGRFGQRPGSPPALETTQGNWVVVRQYDAVPSTAAFPWSAFSAQIGAIALSNVSGRLAAVASKSNGAWQVSLFSYDADGRLANRYTYTQDNSGGSVLTAVNTTIAYSRDLRDAITQRALTVGSNTFNHWYDYDSRGLLWRVYASTGATKPGSPDVTYSYRPSGQVQDRQFQGGPLVPLQYSIREQLASIGDPASSAYPFSARYGYNANGTISDAEFYSAGSPAAAKRYKYVFSTYDALNRVKSADFSSWNGSAWASTLAYDLPSIGYDAAGNITALQRYRQDGTLIDNLTYSYPSSSNRLSSLSEAAGASAETWDAEGGSFTYDGNGNLLSAPAPYAVSAVTYDHRNLPTSLTSNGVTSAYRYDDTGERIVKQVGSGNGEIYVLDGATTLGVVTVNASGTPVSWYFNVLAGDRVVGRQPNTGSRSYYQADLLGTTRSVVQGATVVESYDYDPWGLLMTGRTLGSGTKEGFTGKERDAETSLDYFGARYYMAALGRFGSLDPLAEKHSGWSPYSYVLGNPLSLVDPDGKQVSAQSVKEFGQGFLDRGVAMLGSFAAGTYNTIQNPGPTVNALYDLATPAGRAVAIANLVTAVDDRVAKWLTGDSRMRGGVAAEASAVALLTVGSEFVPSEMRGASALSEMRAGASAEAMSLFRAVTGEELADLSARSGAFRNPFGIESKYFSETAEGAASYARQAFEQGGGVYQGPYTLVRTSIPSNLVTPIMRAQTDRGIPTIVIPTDKLPQLTPAQPMPFIPRPDKNP
jgi:RHS repeat-associated protein